MTSQQTAFGKGNNNCSTYQLLSGTSNNLGRGTVQFINPNPNITVPIRIPSTESLSGLPIQSIPIQITTTNNVQQTQQQQQQQQPQQKSLINNQPSRSLLNIPVHRPTGNGGSVIQLQMLGPQSVNKVGDKKLELDKVNQQQQQQNHGLTSMARMIANQRSDLVNVSLQGKMQQEGLGSNSLQLPSGHVHIVSSATSNNSKLQGGINSVQMRTSTGGVYFLPKTMGMKSGTSDLITTTTSVSTPSSIIVRKPSLPANLQLISSVQSKPNIAAKTSSLKCAPIAPKNSMVVQKPIQINKKSSLGSVSISTAPKSSLSTYISSIKKPVSLISNPEQLPQKKVYKINKITLPVTQYNVQLSNGQQVENKQNDQSLQNVMGQMSNVPPLQPISKNISSMSSSNPVPSTSSQHREYQADTIFTSSSTNAKDELISEKEYTISIPDTDVSDDTYTVSISEVNKVNNTVEKSFTIQMPDKVKSLINKNSSVVQDSGSHDSLSISNSIPAILRRSNNDNSERKGGNNMRRRISSNIDEVKMDPIRNNKGYADVLSRLAEIPNVSLIGINNGTNNKKSLFCDEEIDAEMDGKNKNVRDALPTISTSSTHVNKDRRKSRVSSDVHLQDNDHLINNSKLVIDTPEDTLGLQWMNGVAHLKGSNLKFNMNEFGLIDVLDKNTSNQSSYKDGNKGREKNGSPEYLCCAECGCHGLPGEFVSKMFCSNTCQNEWSKKERQAVDPKKRRKPKKVLMKNHEKLENKVTMHVEPSNSELKNSSEEYVQDPMSDVVLLNNSWLSDDGFCWNKYLEFTKAEVAPEKCFKSYNMSKHQFKRGMKLEAIDPMNPSVFSVVTIVNIHGHRLCLHFDGYHDNADFWVNVDSPDIFPAGWCERNKRTVKPPLGYEEGTFSWTIYLRQSKAIAASTSLFMHLNEPICSNLFKTGMMLEAEDRKYQVVCMASVSDVINNRVLIHFDGWDNKYDYWVDPSSPYIHAVGWAESKGIPLIVPDSIKESFKDKFSWKEYLAKTKSVPAPTRAFKARPPYDFEVGMKLEAVDKRAPFLIRVASILKKGMYKILILFDGWPKELAYWVDDDSPDIHPVGWCLRTGHPLEPPLSENDYEIVGECGTKGCRGFGNLNEPNMTTHKNQFDCPYSLPAKEPKIFDRFEGTLSLVETLRSSPKELRKITPLQISDNYKSSKSSEVKKEISIPERSERISPKRKAEEDTKSSLLDDEFSSNESKRRRELSPSSRRKVESSVYNPGYLIDPNLVKPPYWGGGDGIGLTEILQNESFKVDPRNWSVSDVQRFVELITKSDEKLTMFTKQKIDGEAFLMLAQNDIKNELGLKLGPTLKIYNSILQLREKILS